MESPPLSMPYRRTSRDDSHREAIPFSPPSTYPSLPWWDKLLNTYSVNHKAS